MLGSKGPSVMLQTPCSSRVSLGGVALPIQSPVKDTSAALGALMRKVTLWSASTSGETTGLGLCAWPATAASKPTRQAFLSFTEFTNQASIYHRAGQPAGMATCEEYDGIEAADGWPRMASRVFGSERHPTAEIPGFASRRTSRVWHDRLFGLWHDESQAVNNSMERIGKYELQEFLGGGMSHVYRARDTVIGRTVAVKVLTKEGCADPETKARFLAEAQMAGNISHDHVMHIYDFGEDDLQRPFLVMEFLRGEDLRHAMQNGHDGDLKQRLRIALDVARALEYIHTLKIVHRDIKPENVHISDTGVVKLMDFGIAKGEGMSLTRAGYVLGTPFYMAPEQVMGQNITPQVDVYAFAMMVFELITGAKPISGDTMERIFYAILNEPVNLEPLRQAGAPESVCALVEKCTLKRPEDRPQGMTPVCAELERILEQMEAPTIAVAAPVPAEAGEVSEEAAPAGRPAWLVPAAIGLVVVVAAGVFFATRLHRTPPVQPNTAAAAAAVTPTLQAPAGMVTVPAGKFLFGEKNDPVNQPAFFIDKTEVTNTSYQQFCTETQHALPPQFPRNSPDLPVVNVTILDAQAFAKWANKRIPTAREWEKAARGTDGRLFPWGNQDDPAKANLNSGHLRPADDLQSGASPYGALQMVGNVWEWVAELTNPSQRDLKTFADLLTPKPGSDEPWYQIRGLSFNDKLQNGALWDSGVVPARWKNTNLGFRCVRDAQ